MLLLSGSSNISRGFAFNGEHLSFAGNEFPGAKYLIIFLQEKAGAASGAPCTKSMIQPAFATVAHRFQCGLAATCA